MNILENLITDPDNNVQTSEAHSIKLEDIEEVETPKTEMDKLIEDEIAYSEIDHKKRFTIINKRVHTLSDLIQLAIMPVTTTLTIDPQDIKETRDSLRFGQDNPNANKTMADLDEAHARSLIVDAERVVAFTTEIQEQIDNHELTAAQKKMFVMLMKYPKNNTNYNNRTNSNT